jgi:aquaporin Z
MDYFALLGEFFGTFLLILVVLASGGNSLMIGGILALITALLGKVSGAHVNPAVSTAMFVRGSLALVDYIGYVVVQLTAGFTSYYVYRAFA